MNKLPINLICVLILLVGMISFQPHYAFAEQVELTPDTNILFDSTGKVIDTYYCKQVEGQFTQSIIDCIEKPIRKAVLEPDPERGLLAMVSKFMVDIFYATVVLVIAIYGIKLMTGQRNAFNSGFGLILRIGICFMLMFNMYGFGDKMFDIFYGIANLNNVGGATPWGQIDFFFAKFMGFATNEQNAIRDGIAALLAGSLLSKNLGIMITLVGSACVIAILLFIFQAVYLYLISIMAFAVLVVISPIVFTLYVFQYRWTERFLNKWFDIFLTTMLTPLLMFSFLGLFMDIPVQTGPPAPGIFTTTVNEVFTKLGGTDYAQRCLRTDIPFMSSWLLPANNSMADVLACPPPLAPGCDQQDRDTSSVQAFVNPYLPNGVNYSPLNAPLIDCGKNDERIKYGVFFVLVKLLFYAVLVNVMLKRIPDIVEDLAGGISTGVHELASPINRAMQSISR